MHETMNQWIQNILGAGRTHLERTQLLFGREKARGSLHSGIFYFRRCSDRLTHGDNKKQGLQGARLTVDLVSCDPS